MFDLVVHYFIGNVPEWVWPAGAGACAIIYFLAHILANFPNFKPYAFIIRPAAGIGLLLCIFMYGGAGVVAVYKADLIEAQHRAEMAEQQAAAATKQLATVLANQEHLTKGRAYGVRQTIEVHRTEVNAECRVDNTALQLYNSAVKNQPVESLRSSGPFK